MRQSPWGMSVILGTMILALLAGGTWLYSAQEQRLQQQVEAELATIAELKVGHIVAWRHERLSDAAVLAENTLLAKSVARWLADRSPEARQEIRSLFCSLQEHYDYQDVLLVDADGQVVLSVSGKSGPLSDESLSSLAAAFRDRRSVFIDLHRDKIDNMPHLSAVAPLFSGQGAERKPLGAVILVSEAREFLYPMIRSWPTLSRTAETLLVRREGDNVLFLNDLRHQPNTALALRLPMSRTDLPALKAVNGEEGIVHGNDYRGIEVVSVVKAIPDSPWFMVSKVDCAEAFSTWRLLSALIILLLLALTGAIAMLFWHRSRKVHYRALLEAETARRISEERHGITLKGIGDAVIATDSQGRVELLNPIAESLTGWPEAEALGQPLDRVFQIINEETRQPVENPVARVLREGQIVGLANHTLLVARDGMERPVADSGSPIRADDGEITGVVLVFRDQTEERRAQEAIRQKQAMLARTESIAHVGSWEWDVATDTVTWSEELFRIFGLDPSQGAPSYGEHHKLFPPEELERERAAVEAAVADGTPYEMELRVLRSDGQIRRCLVRGHAEMGPQGRAVRLFGSLQDVTEQRQAEENYKTLFREMLNGFALHEIILDDQGAPENYRFLAVNPAFERMTGLSATEIVGKTVLDVLPGTEPHWIQTFGKVALTGEPTLFNNFSADLDKHFEVTAFRPAPNQFACIFADITERHRAEQERSKLQAQLLQAQKMESVGRLAGGVAHDFNNMLGVILGHVEIAMEETDPSLSLRADLKQIQTAAQRSAGLTRQLLAFARKQTVAPKVLDLNETVAGMLKMLRRLIGEDIDLGWMPGVELWSVKMDPAQIDQILANLCVNARDAIAGVGKVSIEAKNTVFDEAYCADHVDFLPGEYVLLAVSDDGCGMDKDVLAPSVRALLHYERGWQRHRPGPGHRLRHRQAERRVRQRLQRAGQRNDFQDLLATIHWRYRRQCRSAEHGDAAGSRGDCLACRGRAGDPGHRGTYPRGLGLHRAGCRDPPAKRSVWPRPTRGRSTCSLPTWSCRK